MNKIIIIIFTLFTFGGCSQGTKTIKVEKLKTNKDFKITFMKNDYLKELDTVNIHIELSEKIVLQNKKTYNFPKNIMFSNDTLFGQNNNYGIGFSVFTYYDEKQIRIRDFKFKKKYKYKFELIIQYRTLIPLSQKEKIINNHLVRKGSIKKDSEYQSYFLKNNKEGIELLNTIIPDSLKGYIVFNIVNKQREHQLYQYHKIDF